jgi:hypothetical protein
MQHNDSAKKTHVRTLLGDYGVAATSELCTETRDLIGKLASCRGFNDDERAALLRALHDADRGGRALHYTDGDDGPRSWFKRYNEAKRAFVEGGSSDRDAIDALTELGYGNEAATHEALDWARKRDERRRGTIIILTFGDDE